MFLVTSGFELARWKIEDLQLGKLTSSITSNQASNVTRDEW